MTVTSTSLLRAQPTGQVKLGGANTYTTVHRVVTDDVDDGVQTVAAAIGTVGETTYAEGDETDTGAYLQSVSPKRDKDKSLYWIVTSQWAPNDSDDPDNHLNEDGELEADPTKWIDDVSFSTSYESRPLLEAVYRGPNAMDHIGRPIGSGGPVVNSAGALIDPPLETQHPIRTHHISQYAATYPEWKVAAFQNAVNSQILTYTLNVPDPELGHHPLQYNKQWDIATARVDSITGTWGRKNGIFYWRTDINVSEDRSTWRLQIPDAGFERAWDVNYDPVETTGEAIHVVALTDVHGQPVRHPVRLDGFGAVLGSTQPTKYLIYSKYIETPMGQLFQ